MRRTLTSLVAAILVCAGYAGTRFWQHRAAGHRAKAAVAAEIASLGDEADRRYCARLLDAAHDEAFAAARPRWLVTYEARRDPSRVRDRYRSGVYKAMIAAAIRDDRQDLAIALERRRAAGESTP